MQRNELKIHGQNEELKENCDESAICELAGDAS